jgi:hypothetical protein
LAGVRPARDNGAVEPFIPLSERPYGELLAELGRTRESGTAVLRDRDGDRHGVTFEAGYVRAVHLAGRFDPLLALLERRGHMSRAARSSCLSALREGARSGDVATAVGHVPRDALRDALRAQLAERFAALVAWAEQRGYDARLEPAGPGAAEADALRVPLGALFRAAGRPLPGVDLGPQPAPGALPGDQRRALRRLAVLLHPDRHPELSDAERRILERQLADATARYHGFHRVA